MASKVNTKNKCWAFVVHKCNKMYVCGVTHANLTKEYKCNKICVGGVIHANLTKE